MGRFLKSFRSKPHDQVKDRLAHLKRRAAMAEAAMNLCYTKNDRDRGFRFCQHLIYLEGEMEMLK